MRAMCGASRSYWSGRRPLDSTDGIMSHTPDDTKDNSGRRPSLLKSAMGTLRAAGHFWASSVNDAAIELIDPQPGEVVLDLGAGLGPATVAAAQHVGRDGEVIAVDPSRFMRSFLRIRRVASPWRSRIRVHPGTAERLPLDDTSIDAVVALNVMHHFDDLERATTEMSRVLKPGGRLLLIDEDFDDPTHSHHHAGGPNHQGPEFVDPERMAELLNAAGLTNATTDHRTIGTEPAYVITANKAPDQQPDS